MDKSIIGPPYGSSKCANTMNQVLSNLSLCFSEKNLLSLEHGITHKDLSLKKLGIWSCPCLLGQYSMGRGLFPNTSPMLTKRPDDGKLDSGFCAEKEKTDGMKTYF